MSLGNIGRALAGQAIESTKKNVMDVFNPSDPPKTTAPPQIPQPGGDNVAAIVLGELQAAQRVLGEDTELRVLFHAHGETIRIHQIFVPAPNILVLAGVDAENNMTRVVTPAGAAQLICKVVKVGEGKQPLRVNVLSPRTKPEAPRG